MDHLFSDTLDFAVGRGAWVRAGVYDSNTKQSGLNMLVYLVINSSNSDCSAGLSLMVKVLYY